MKKVFLIHGFQGEPNGGWRPWLMRALAEQGVYACALAMPSPSAPVLKEWIREIARHVEGNPRDQIYLVGHSLGVPAILHYLGTTKAKNIKGIVLVSGPFFSTTKKAVMEFLAKPFVCDKIAAHTKHRVVIHGNDDRAVPWEQGEALAAALGAEFVTVKNGGHLNGSAGWTELPVCLEALRGMMGKGV